MMGLATARAALGFGEGATFPGGLRTVVQTLPVERRSRGVALAYSGGSLGAVITPVIITPIVVVWGWRAAFWFTGLIGFAWIVLWWFVSRLPAVRHVSPSENRAALGTKTPRFTDPRLWSFISAYALGALPLGFILYAASIYLNQAMGKSQVEIGRVLWIPPLGWEVGYFFWGYLVDRGLRNAHSSFHLHRRLMGLALVFSLPLALTPRLESFPLVMSELFLAMFVAAGFIILSVSYASSVYSGEHSGFIAGVGAGAWSAVVAVVMPLFGRLFDRQQYEAAFLLATGFPVLGFALWWMLGRDRPALGRT
jgi:ACS family hexuronate transporter-like MFS transporter